MTYFYECCVKWDTLIACVCQLSTILNSKRYRIQNTPHERRGDTSLNNVGQFFVLQISLVVMILKYCQNKISIGQLSAGINKKQILV